MRAIFGLLAAPAGGSPSSEPSRVLLKPPTGFEGLPAATADDGGLNMDDCGVGAPEFITGSRLPAGLLAPTGVGIELMIGQLIGIAPTRG